MNQFQVSDVDIPQMSLTDLIPIQDYYYLLTNGAMFARHGTLDTNGVLVLANLKRAEQFCMRIGKYLPMFVPVKMSAEEFLEIAEAIGAGCVAEGLTV
jgi:hypothetical protein